MNDGMKKCAKPGCEIPAFYCHHHSNDDAKQDKSIGQRFGEAIGIIALVTATLTLFLLCASFLYHLSTFLIP